MTSSPPSAAASLTSILLAVGDDRAPSLVYADGATLAYAGLRDAVAGLREALRRCGIGRGDRVAIVLPGGPELALAFLAVTETATAAPLNPAYRTDEFAFYLEDLGAKAVIVEAGATGAIVEAAARVGVPIVDLHADRPSGPGAAALAPRHPRETRAAPDERPGGDDVALVLHTSGTTARPKIVPLSHRNLALSAQNIARGLALVPADRLVGIMPLFHIHGLVAGLAAPLAAGSSVVCLPGFRHDRVYDAIERHAPTWITGVPTMYQALLAHVRPEAIAANRLRFVRSSSAPLPPSLAAEIEAVFGCPAIEAYGMTEASHQVTSNPLPPLARRPGSVGPARDDEVRIVDAAGRRVADGTVGEVVLRSARLTSGYEAPPEANASAFVDGWFRTGDLGRIDADGYLWLTGRIKEIINRGGEKISPREIDDVLCAHPAVLQAVTFAVPDPVWGEDIAAAIVIRPGRDASEADLRRHASRTLAPFKLPRRFVFVDEIPKGPSGKLQRIGLAKLLGLA
ncbi:MAG: AMP-binding protein [Burkholderiales bacterium]